MLEPTAEGFADFFQALWAKTPFAWQRDLAERILEIPGKGWPEAIALPTAAGKTACIDIAVYAIAARARQTETGWVSDAARRIFFVVDRRIIVDEAFERAKRIAEALRRADGGVVASAADRLRELAGGSVPLMCFQLRGGMYRSDAWARSPLQPAVIASTVDQIGSRLLFRAYGRSPKAWPIQAGMTGNDALILLDEAHCAQPFMETLHAVRKYRQWAEIPLPNPFDVAILSATPPEVRDVFRDTSDEPSTPGHPLGARQLASKPATLIQSKAGGKKALETLAADLAKTAESLAGGKPLATVIFVNYVATAREVYRILSKKYGNNAILLTGRMRPIDKDDAVLHRLRHLASDRSWERLLPAPVFVIATQTLEVGADLDFDLLVTECASLDALRQRFGRLDRMGRLVKALAAILMRADRVKSSADDPVYGEAICRTWQWLNDNADETGHIDMGIASLANRLPEGLPLAALNAPAGHAPVMLPAHVDCWGQTHPAPMPTPDVALFLHGPVRAAADVQAVWRADLDLTTPESREASLDVLSICPPSAAEALAVPIWAMRQWMAAEDAQMDAISDVEGASGASQARRTGVDRQVLARRVVRWRGRSEALVAVHAGEIRPGDVIVIPAVAKGWESLGDLPAPAGAKPVLDWGDRAFTKARAKPLLRLHPDVIAEWPDSEIKNRMLELSRSAISEFDEDPDGFLDSMKDALSSMAENPKAPDWLRSAADSLTKDPGLKRAIMPHPLGIGIVLRGTVRLDPQTAAIADEEVDWFSDEDDASASGTTHVPLTFHLDGVGRLVRRFGAGCGLPESLTMALETTGKLHDAGKGDPRFQALLRGGNIYARGEPLAKSEDIPQGRRAFERARNAAGYPRGGRHELLSVRMAESSPPFLPNDEEMRDLVLHLIGAHHGYCRPFAPVITDEHPVKAEVEIDGRRLHARSDTGLERLDSGVADRFWRLTRRYGWWGLAWLEAIFRLSDHRRSEREEQERKGAR